MTAIPLQQSAPQAPPIPALPARPGAATGTGTAPVAAPISRDVQQAIREAGEAARQAGQAAREAGIAAREAAQQGSGGNAVIAGTPADLSQTTTSTDFPWTPEDVQHTIREVIPIGGMMLTAVMVMFIGFPIARAFGRRMNRKVELEAVKASDLQPQIRQLQESIDAMAIELERISEAQRFTAKLMNERAPALPASEARR